VTLHHDALLWAVLAVINASLVVFLAPLLDGVERKVRARVQRRVGPPILQTVYDLIKLYRRPPTQDPSAGPFHGVAPFIAFPTALIAALVIPSVLPYRLGFPGDLIVVAYLLVSVSTITSFGAASSSIPYSVVGGWREASLTMASELALGAAVAAIASANGSLLLASVMPAYSVSGPKPSVLAALAGLAIITYVEGGRLPFEIAEAEPELAGGVTVGYGGSSLALLLHSLMIKRVLFTSLFLDLLIPWDALPVLGGYCSWVVLRAALFTAALTLTSVVFAALEASYGRCRPGHALTLVKRAVIVSGVALIASCFGI